MYCAAKAGGSHLVLTVKPSSVHSTENLPTNLDVCLYQMTTKSFSQAGAS